MEELKQIVERLTTVTQDALPPQTLKNECQPCPLPGLKKTPEREVVEVLSDDEDALFEPTPVATRKPKK